MNFVLQIDPEIQYLLRSRSQVFKVHCVSNPVAVHLEGLDLERFDGLEPRIPDPYAQHADFTLIEYAVVVLARNTVIQAALYDSDGKVLVGKTFYYVLQTL